MIASGTSPLNWTSTVAGTYYIHYNTNSSCGTSATCRTATITRSLTGCTNTLSYMTVAAPVSSSITIASCMYAGEYNTVTGCTAGATYISTTDLPNGFFTIHQGTYNGPIVAAGITPLSWTATVAGTYYIHLNTNSSCGTDALCHSSVLTHSCTAAPTSVTATPSTVCAGVSTNLRAISAGNTIRWYTVSTGGTSIGSSASGANFAVTPAATTTYYAEAWTGSCASTRVAVTANVLPVPAAPTSVTASPAIICSGSTNLNATIPTYSGGFSGVYDPASWTISHSPITDMGTVNTASAPTSVSMTSSNNGNTGAHSVFYTVTIVASGNITFNWDYVTTDIHGSHYDRPQYAINGVIIGDIPGFVDGGLDIQSGSSTIAVTAGQTFSLVMTAIDDILGAATCVFSGFTAPAPASGNVNWYTVASGGASIGSSTSGANFSVTPGSTMTYYAEAYNGTCASATRTPVTVTVGTASTAPTIVSLAPMYCPNTTITVTAGGGTAGSGSNIYWYTGANGTGTLLGTGTSYNLTTSNTMTLYARREGACNTTGDDTEVVNVRSYIYAANATTTSNYCTDDNGWHHFYVGSNIVLSVQGDFSNAPVGFPMVTIWDNGTYYQNQVGTFYTPAQCISGLNPGEEQFEMERSWNLDMGGGAPIGTYNVRFYYQPAEKTAVETAAANWMALYSACGYTYKYAVPNGFYWFKNTGAPYSAPDFDGTHYGGATGSTPNAVNYTQMSGVTSFSGGSGAVILVPSPLLNVKWLYFTGDTDGKVNHLKWATENEQNTLFFEVQRSANGIDFEPIGEVAAANNSDEQRSYTFDDITPLQGQNYYRLRLVSNDNNEVFSNVVALEIEKADNYAFFPNPTQDVVFYQFNGKGNDQIQIEVVDVLGRTLTTRRAGSIAGLNRVSIDLAQFPNGTYMVRAKHLSENTVHTAKIVKNKP